MSFFPQYFIPDNFSIFIIHTDDEDEVIHTDLQAHLSQAICPPWKLTEEGFTELCPLCLACIPRPNHLYRKSELCPEVN